LVVDQTKPFLGYQLLPSVKPRRDALHSILVNIAKQIDDGYSVMVWDVDRLLTELTAIRITTTDKKPRLASEIELAWKRIANADDEELIDLRGFSRLPEGHFVDLVAIREKFTDDQLLARLRGVRNLSPYRRALKGDPRSEEFWGVLIRYLLDRREAEQGWKFFQAWKRAGRPDPLYGCSKPLLDEIPSPDRTR